MIGRMEVPVLLSNILLIYFYPLLSRIMKKILSLFLIALLVMPAFASSLPHDVVHALHVQQIEHRLVGSHDHSHHHSHHDSATETQASKHHPIHFDVTTYFSDYLNVDLQRADQGIFTDSAFDIDDIDFTLLTFVNLYQYDNLASNKSRAPPDWRKFRPANTPPYLSTQRLRI